MQFSTYDEKENTQGSVKIPGLFSTQPADNPWHLSHPRAKILASHKDGMNEIVSPLHATRHTVHVSCTRVQHTCAPLACCLFICDVGARQGTNDISSNTDPDLTRRGSTEASTELLLLVLDTRDANRGYQTSRIPGSHTHPATAQAFLVSSVHEQYQYYSNLPVFWFLSRFYVVK